MAFAIRELAHLQIPLQKILDATNNFSDKNIIGKGDFGKVYRGKLEHNGEMIKIAAQRLDRKYGHGDVEFWTVVSTLSSFPRNDYTVDMIGFCDEEDEKIVINHHYPEGSLSQYISDPLTLDVSQRLAIAERVCNAIDYIHTHLEGDYIIHRNINSSTILLDAEREPRLSGFEFSIKHTKERMNEVVISEAIGTQGYIDPATEKYGGVNHKSDIYSVGVVLFELLCGRKAFEENTLLAPLAKFHYENGTLKDIAHPGIWNQMNPKSFKCFSKAAYSCLQEDPSLRPKAEKLAGQLMKAESLQYKTNQMKYDDQSLYEYLLDSSLSDLDLSKVMEDEMQREKHPIFEKALDKSSPDVWKVKKWEHLRIGLTHIHSPLPSPTLKYAPYPKDHKHVTFKQEIEYYEREYVSFVEHKDTNELHKRRHTVMAKMVEYKEDVFLREIEILVSCRHPNIQSFLGFYDNGHMMMLFYEYASNKYLYHSLDDVNLKWGKRLKICIDVARGLDYLHNGMEDQKMVIHGNIHSGNIKLDDISGAKIVGFEKSVILHSNQDDDSLQVSQISCLKCYKDTGYAEICKLKRESDVLSFGVVMFEILCGRLRFGVPHHVANKMERMASIARGCFDEGTIKKNLATGIKEENYGNNLFLKKGPNEDSLDTFINITYKCLAESENQRPEIKVVIKELHKALSFHENHKDPLKMSFNDIKLATQDFDRANCIGGGGFGLVYKGKLAHGKVNGHSTIVVKKLDTSLGQGEKQYYNELQILSEYNHENVIGLIGYSNETDEKLIVYEHASKGSLDKHLNNASLTWRGRLKICIDIATGLTFLHEGIQGQRVVIHRDIKTANILLFDDWKAKVGDYGLSFITRINEETNFTIDHPCGTKDYVDPMYLKSSILTIESDVYSFGVALFEILYGRATYTLPKHERQSLPSFIKHKFENKKQTELVFEAISEKIVPRALTTFLNIVYRCLNDDREIRPTTRVVLTQLKKALEFQDEQDEKDKEAQKDVIESPSDSKVKKWEHLRIGLTHISHSSRSSVTIQGIIFQKKVIECYDREYVYLKNIGELPKIHHTVVQKMVKYKEDVFLRELDTRGSCNHPNIQSVIGFYDEGSTKMLFYEYVSFRFLYQFLNDGNLTWEKRLKICIDVAHGLDYLHNEMEDKKMITHGGINCENIELDETWGAKIVGFQKAVMFDLTVVHDSVIQSEFLTPHLKVKDPAKTRIRKRKEDIYSFGVVMHEILCGARLPDVIDSNDCMIMESNKQRCSLIIKEENYGNNFFLNNGPNEDSLNTFIDIMYKCLTKTDEHLNMKVVIKELQKALFFHDEDKI